MNKAIYDIRHAAICGAITAARKGKKLTLGEVAQSLKNNGRSSLSAETIGQIEKGQRKLDVVELVDLAYAIDVPWSRLLPTELKETM
jgi:transcriptional regulator with XRE-family HTH domain